MKQIKNIMMLIVVMFVCVAANAQYVAEVNYSRMECRVGNAWYNMGDIPGGSHLRRGDNIMMAVNNHFARLRHDNAEDYMRELTAWNMSGGLAGIAPVRYSEATMGGGMMMGSMGVGMVGGMGYGMQNSGMVMGSMGMAGATSNVVIDNSNLAETIGSGITMNYDTGSNSLNISGDPITAGLRLFSAIGSKTKKSNRRTQQQVVYQQQTNGYANGQVLQDAQGNLYTMQNGVLVPMQQTRSAQPTATRSAQTRTTNNTNRTNVQTNGQMTYNVSTGTFASGF